MASDKDKPQPEQQKSAAKKAAAANERKRKGLLAKRKALRRQGLNKAGLPLSRKGKKPDSSQ